MRRGLLVLLLCASTVARGADLTICAVPDLQNLVSNEGPEFPDENTDCAVNPPNCVEPYCDPSPYCSGTWEATSAILLANLAYSLTGQTSLIDYSAVKGTDPALSGAQYPVDHAPCDVIIGVGDNVDSLSGSGNPSYSTISAMHQRQVDRVTAFWGIIKDSGTPFLPARGNHDPELVYRYMMTTLGFASLPFVWAAHSDGDQYAIKVTTASGFTLGVVSLDYGGTYSPGDERTASEAAWGGATLGAESVIGLGANYPTAVVSHTLVNSSATANGLLQEGNGLFADPANDELFLALGGHITPTPPVSRKAQGTNASGRPFWMMFSNWQEWNRHNSVGATSRTPSDGIGGAYTVIEIDRAASQICAHDWNPYFQLRSSIGNGQDNGATELFTSGCWPLNWGRLAVPGRRFGGGRL